MGKVEPRNRQWRIDLSKRPLVEESGTLYYSLQIISFREDVEKRNHEEIMRKLNVILFSCFTSLNQTPYMKLLDWLHTEVVFDYYESDRTPSVLVGNKMDERTIPPSHVTTDQGEIASLGMHAKAYFDCSAKCNASCGTLLDYLLKMIALDRRRR
ncbi:hypothetical protein TNIN_174671 [Trichonephila inaurata madagascariensis]|uniref:Uncharacterized protein n=1 Tax=Trichonephila inaurata madagascariensis TaxID=2747483 RepID=A0A8X6XDL9_9ARAC|nr:hypothetical protein TNIN_72651 [Trichonephila inaurata madagascariensis]GFY51650.1 hypothetical protein TNIN_174671 [Trichonephila inaurata madagascariensis]